jgi:hypothetical protein
MQNEKIEDLIREKFFEILAEGRDAYMARVRNNTGSYNTWKQYEMVVDQFIRYMRLGYRTTWAGHD